MASFALWLNIRLHIPMLESAADLCTFLYLIFIWIRQRISIILPLIPSSGAGRLTRPPTLFSFFLSFFFFFFYRGSFKSLSPLCCRWIGAHLNWKRTWPSPLCFPRCLPKSQLSFVWGHARPRHVPFSGWMFALRQKRRGGLYLIHAWKLFFPSLRLLKMHLQYYTKLKGRGGGDLNGKKTPVQEQFRDLLVKHLAKCTADVWTGQHS